ncbi:uncharacterized protein LOC129594923 [Paramacrobiotus metropolitanus]|uniref:uncharacterized protein LOC129594923 n=1 Tax=Paramacrobiotus metropolitanus TaxID=2943436 RepID=UPI0024463E0F|nr:uncharacterized protein LOC129594923 [Paramacrobiotus metropolitanus]
MPKTIPSTLAMAVHRARQTHSLSALAKLFDMSKSWIIYVLARFDPHTGLLNDRKPGGKKPSTTPEQDAELLQFVRDHHQGDSIRTIAAAWNSLHPDRPMSRTRIHARLQEAAGKSARNSVASTKRGKAAERKPPVETSMAAPSECPPPVQMASDQRPPSLLPQEDAATSEIPDIPVQPREACCTNTQSLQAQLAALMEENARLQEQLRSRDVAIVLLKEELRRLQCPCLPV